MDNNIEGMEADLEKIAREKKIDLSSTIESDESRVRVVLSKLEDDYYLNCYDPDQVPEYELPGQIVGDELIRELIGGDDMKGQIYGEMLRHQQLKRDELLQRLLNGQLIFSGTLSDVCDRIEQNLRKFRIPYKSYLRDRQQVPECNLVSHKLTPQEKDPGSGAILYLVIQTVKRTYVEHVSGS